MKADTYLEWQHSVCNVFPWKKCHTKNLYQRRVQNQVKYLKILVNYFLKKLHLKRLTGSEFAFGYNKASRFSCHEKFYAQNLQVVRF